MKVPIMHDHLFQQLTNKINNKCKLLDYNI